MNLIKKLLNLLGFGKVSLSEKAVVSTPTIIRVKSPKKVLVETPSGARSWKILRYDGERITIRRTGHPRCPVRTIDFRPSIGDRLRLEGFIQR